MTEDLEQLYRDLRPYSFAIAYRMLGSVSEAEDVVQDAFLRLASTGADPESAKAYLATVTTRLAIDVLRSARVRRETYVGPWLPEPMVGATTDDPVELADSLSMAFLVVLEKLTPVERAVFLLHDVFGYDHSEVATIVGKSEANCRQLAGRARRHLDAERPRFVASRQEGEQLAERFFAACEGRDIDGLLELLAGDAALYGDGGIAGSGLRHPVHGRENVARVLTAWFRQIVPLGMRILPSTINGGPGATLVDADGRLVNVIGLDVMDGEVQTVRSIINPEKLGHLGPLSPLGRRGSSRG